MPVFRAQPIRNLGVSPESVNIIVVEMAHSGVDVDLCLEESAQVKLAYEHIPGGDGASPGYESILILVEEELIPYSQMLRAMPHPAFYYPP